MMVDLLIKIILVLTLCSLSTIAVASRSTDLDRLESQFGLRLKDGPQDKKWQTDEAKILLQLLEKLPRPIAEVGKLSRFGFVRLRKSYDRPEIKDYPSGVAALFWQLTVTLYAEDVDVRQKLNAAESSLERKSYYVFLKRRVVHQLLLAYDAYHKKSQSRAWRAISGWRFRDYFGLQFRFLPKPALNQDPRSFAYFKSVANPTDDFATFGELFFVTPDSTVENSIKCRTPAKYQFFKSNFPDYVPYLDKVKVSCRVAKDGFLDDIHFVDPSTSKPIDLGPFDEENIEGFELLYATPGVGDAAEIAGHLILRIKMKNNPVAKKIGIENPHDLVISFLADTDAGKKKSSVAHRPDQIPEQCKKNWLGLAGAGDQADFDAFHSMFQSLKGLAGGFLTIFDRQTLEQTVQNYTVLQDRNLLRYKLVLTAAQKKSLIDRLFLAKKNFKSKYYFFDRNCASILMQIIGEGIGDEEVANFDPFIVPPNALVSLLQRRGLAQAVHPAFYSYRKKGYVAQDILKEELEQVTKKYNQFQWPRYSEVINSKLKRRLQAAEKLLKIARQPGDARKEIYRLATFIQESELVFADHEMLCNQMTSPVTKRMRQIQKGVIQNSEWRPEPVNIDQLVYQRYRGEEQQFSTSGSVHTRLSSLGFAVGKESSTATSFDSYVQIQAALHKQDMGSPSRLSMQRATSVSLGALELGMGQDDDLNVKINRWRVTGMTIRKLKERVSSVPSYFSNQGKVGLGLTVLDTRGHREQGYVWSHLIGGEVIFNLLSSKQHNDFIYFSAGANVDSIWRVSGTHGNYLFHESQIRPSLPLRVEGLWTFDNDRQLQLRLVGIYASSFIGSDIAKRQILTGRLNYRLSNTRGPEVNLFLKSDYERQYDDPYLRDHRSLEYLIGTEVNRL